MVIFQDLVLGSSFIHDADIPRHVIGQWDILFCLNVSSIAEHKFIIERPFALFWILLLDLLLFAIFVFIFLINLKLQICMCEIQVQPLPIIARLIIISINMSLVSSSIRTNIQHLVLGLLFFLEWRLIRTHNFCLSF